MYIRIDSLGVIFPIWIVDETIIGVNVPCFVDGMVARTDAPRGVLPRRALAVRIIALMLRIGPWRKREVHQMCDGRLAFPTVDGLHGGLTSQAFSIPYIIDLHLEL